MSVCNGAAKKAKKNSVISKVAVHPMQHSNSQASIPDVANSTPRAGYVARGQLISPQPIQYAFKRFGHFLGHVMFRNFVFRNFFRYSKTSIKTQKTRFIKFFNF